MKKRLNFDNLTFKYKSFNDYLKYGSPTESPEHSPFLLPDMLDAIYFIQTFKDKKIIIYGDYDCDGISSTVIMLLGLRQLGYTVDYYIPQRSEGYGMNYDSVKKIISQKYDLVITVDNGITASEHINTLRNSNVSVIITDHHEPLRDGSLPNANYIINPKRLDSQYPFKDICGALVAYKFIETLFDVSHIYFDKTIFLPLATIATIADVMPLIDENRTIVKSGLNIISSDTSFAFKELFKVINKLDKLSSLKASDIAFYIGPLINASSRVGDLSFSLQLLLNYNDPIICADCAKKLGEFNKLRKEFTDEITTLSLKEVENYYPQINFIKEPIVVCGNNWNKGVIGIVASRLVEIYQVPVIVLSEHNGQCHGSCRNFGNISIISLLDYCKDLLLSYGGHIGAAGLTLSLENLEKFRNKVHEYSKFINKDEYIIPTSITCPLSFKDLTVDNYKKVLSLEPFGEANTEPVFFSKLKINSSFWIGKEKNHLKLNLSEDGINTVEAIFFFAEDYKEIISSLKEIELVYTLSINTFSGIKIQLNVIDVNPF